MSDINVRFGTQTIVVSVGENTPEAQRAANRAEQAATEAQAHAAAALAAVATVQPGLNTRFAEESLANLLMADATGYGGTFRVAGPGSALDADFSTGTYSHGLQRIAFSPTLEFDRTGAGYAIGGGDDDTFGEDVARLLDGRLFLDAGGTNIVPLPTDFTNAAWTKTRFGTPTLTTGPGGANTAYAIRETVDNGAHQLSQIISGLASEDQFTLHWLIKPVGRDYAFVTVQNADTAKNFTGRFSFLTGAFLTAYPAGSAATSVDGGVLDYGDGWFLVWLTGTFTAAETGLRIFLGTMSDSTTTSFAGDTNKGLDVAGIWGVQGTGVPVNFLTGTRSAETLDVPLGQGWYISRRVDGEGEVLENLQIAAVGDRWDLKPRDGNLWLTEAQAYTVALLDDTSTQSDNADGDTVVPTTGPNLVPYHYTGTVPMLEPATNGKIASGWYELTPQSGNDGTTYWIADLGDGASAKFAKATVDFAVGTSGGEAISNMTFCIAFCNNEFDNLLEEMPVHVVFSVEGFVAQYRTIADGFVTRSALQRAVGTGTTDVAVYIHGDKLTVTMWGESITTQDPAFEVLDLRYAFFEIQSTSNNTTRTVRFADPVVSTAEVGPEPAYVAAVPQNLLVPSAVGTAVAGNTYTIQRGYWTSNDGALAFAQKWQFDLVDIPLATAISYVTTNGVDEGKKIRVGERPSNDSGQAADYAFSAESAPLA